MSNQAAAKSSASLTRRYLPGIWVLREYQRSWLRGDLLAGLTVSAYLVPQVMAYAEVAGLPAIAGLWAAVGPLVVYAILGSSRQLSVGPESSTALMTAAAVTVLIAGDQQLYAETAAALALAVGAICLVGWLARLGFLANLLSHPVLIGYMAGIAILMIVSQLSKVTGIDVEGDSTLTKLRFFIAHLGQVHLPTLLVAAVTFVVLVAFQRLLPRWPGPLIAMVLAAVAVAVLDLGQMGVATVGSVPRGLPPVSILDFSSIDLSTLVPAALGVTIVAYSDNIATARAFAARRREVIDARQEFLALGGANLAAGVFSGFPVSSSGSRTVIGDAIGSRTQLYSLVAAGVLLLTMLFLGPALSTFPLAALGGLVVFAALRLIDFAELRRIARFRRSELFLALATAAAVLIFDVLYGIAVAVALSILDLLRRIARPHDGILGYVPGMAGMHDVDDYDTGRQVPGLLVYRYDAPLFFANAEDFKRRALASVDGADPPVEWFLLNAEANTEVDLTAVDALEEVRRTLAERGIVFALARVKFELREILTSAGFVDRIGEDRVFMTLPTAVSAYEQWYAAHHGGEAPSPRA
ncbi:MAG TPA: sulfate permease [Propionibacteriaceae bacterium]|nr:sulfate permease [Propionibacteriaceae bacterium]